MEQIITVACKLQAPQQAASELDAILKAFASACNYINQTVPDKMTNSVRIQTLTYQDIRLKFGLSANQAVRAIGRVAANRKTAKEKGKTVKQFTPTSADYDARIFSFREKDWTVSLTLLNKRQRFKLLIGNYQRSLLTGGQPTSAQLVKRRDGSYYINIQVKCQKPDPSPNINTFGVDLGRRDIAHTSKGQSFCGEEVKEVRDHHSKQRQSLQQKASKGTRSTRRSARKKLQRLSGKERRFQTWVNHNISLQIVLYALASSHTIVLEDLTGIREKINKQPRGMQERRRSNNWAFYQLRNFIVYKAGKFGVSVIFVNPAYSSQACHKCLHIGIRKDKLFECPDCGYKGDADYNGANVLAVIGAAFVNRPGSPSLSCSLPRFRATESPNYSAA